MAKNPAWYLPLTGWKTNFSTWINTLEAKDLLQAKIFFDFRVSVSLATAQFTWQKAFIENIFNL